MGERAIFIDCQFFRGSWICTFVNLLRLRYNKIEFIRGFIICSRVREIHKYTNIEAQQNFMISQY